MKGYLNDASSFKEHNPISYGFYTFFKNLLKARICQLNDLHDLSLTYVNHFIS